LARLKSSQKVKSPTVISDSTERRNS